MSQQTTTAANQDAREAWDQNAAFWNQRMGEGNDFVEMLIWPPTERLLAIEPGHHVLDVACGNGLTSRRLAKLGARVTAIDFSEKMIACARELGTAGDAIDYAIVDATDHDALINLEYESFDAVLCNMALFDMAAIEPLFRAVPKILRSSGRFVSSILHPCFNNPFTKLVGEREDRDNEVVMTYLTRSSAYMTASTCPGLAIPGQPVPHPLFHRSLTDVLSSAFRAGLVLDAFEERAFPPDHLVGREISWNGNFSEIPAVVVMQMRPARRSF